MALAGNIKPISEEEEKKQDGDWLDDFLDSTEFLDQWLRKYVKMMETSSISEQQIKNNSEFYSRQLLELYASELLEVFDKFVDSESLQSPSTVLTSGDNKVIAAMTEAIKNIDNW